MKLFGEEMSKHKWFAILLICYGLFLGYSVGLVEEQKLSEDMLWNILGPIGIILIFITSYLAINSGELTKSRLIGLLFFDVIILGVTILIYLYGRYEIISESVFGVWLLIFLGLFLLNAIHAKSLDLINWNKKRKNKD